MSLVAALYIDPRGPYPKLLGPELCWDETRDARTYAGPWPVVAHPPCGPWGCMASMCEQDASLGLLALEQVRRYGGIVEQPRNSRLFAGLPIVEVNQLAWGHACSKRTWLYAVGCAIDGIKTGGTPTHQLRARHNGSAATEPYLMASKEMRRRTPLAFAEWLVLLARHSVPPEAEKERA